MATRKIIAVVGATGAQGGGLVRAILADPDGGFAARAITRKKDSDKAKALAKAGADAKIRVFPEGQAQPFEFPFSFDGFTAAHDDMVASNKAKGVSEQELQAAQAAAAAAPPAK